MGMGGQVDLQILSNTSRSSPHRSFRFLVIQDYYSEKFGCESDFVAYGADIVERGTGREMLAEYGVQPERYFLFVSRLEPENNAHLVVEAFEKVDTDMNLLIVGSAPFADDYIRRLTDTKDKRIIFPGALYGGAYQGLRANAYVYVNAMEVGGTHPAILEAMGAGNCVLVSDIAYNAEAVAEAGVQFKSRDADDCRAKMQWLVEHPRGSEGVSAARRSSACAPSTTGKTWFSDTSSSSNPCLRSRIETGENGSAGFAVLTARIRTGTPNKGKIHGVAGRKVLYHWQPDSSAGILPSPS